jgi:uncharacterized protein
MSNTKSSAIQACAIAVMAKASLPGRTKTRLVPPLTTEQAAEINTAFLRDIAANLVAAQAQASISPWMAYAPAGAEDFFRSHLPASIGLLETVAPDLGACLIHAVRSLLSRGYESACVLNSDSPTLPTAYLVTAATALSADGDRMVIGPSTDGGYYLLGLKRPHLRLFQEVDWSTERVFEQTMARAREIGLPAVVLPAWYDVDDASTLRTLVGEVVEGRPFKVVGSRSTSCEHSRSLLERLMADGDLASSIGALDRTSRVA